MILENYTAPIVETVNNNVCDVNYNNLFYLILLPLIIFIILLFLYKYLDNISKFVVSKKRDFGYISIWMINPNKNIVQKEIKLDKYNKFEFKKRTYDLSEMNNYIIGYLNRIPLLLYDYRFILPLKLTERTLTNNALKELGYDKQDLFLDKKVKGKVSALILKIDSALVHALYKKKLLHDLYEAMKSDNDYSMIFYIVGGLILLIILYYTGLLDKILAMFGVTL